jgi:membrane-associated protein
MDLDLIMGILDEKGYLGLFLWLWMGIFGVPVPNEVFTLTVGFAAAMKVLHPAAAFLVTYLGILAALTTLYLLGRLLGRRLLNFMEKRKRFSKSISQSLIFMEKYHAFSLTLSYFIPGVRNFVPLLYGFSKLPYRVFALFSYTGALVWLTVVFTIGYLFGDHSAMILKYGKEFGLAAIAVFAVLAIWLVRRKVRSRPRAIGR